MDRPGQVLAKEIHDFYVSQDWPPPSRPMPGEHDDLAADEQDDADEQAWFDGHDDAAGHHTTAFISWLAGRG